MIFVDTSTWIQYFKGNDPKIVSSLNELLDNGDVALSSVVWLEILSGARRNELATLKRVLSALPRYTPSIEAWKQIEVWIQSGMQNGHRFSVTDLLIASIAFENKGALWSLDSDYKRMEKLGFIKLFKSQSI